MTNSDWMIYALLVPIKSLGWNATTKIKLIRELTFCWLWSVVHVDAKNY